MDTNYKTPAYRAIFELMDVARGSHSIDNAWLYALTWLAAGRLVMDGHFAEAVTINDLISPAAWGGAERDDLIPAEAKALVWGASGDIMSESAIRTRALSIVTTLIQEYSGQDWDVIDAPWQQSGIWRGSIDNGVALAPELCNLTFDVLNAPRQSTIWIPFDPSGQLVIRAVRRGLSVIAAGPGRRNDTHLRLLLAIEGQAQCLEPTVIFDIARDAGHKRDLTADYIIATPPFGMKIHTGTGWRQWEGYDQESQGSDNLYQRLGPVTQVQLDRSDSWTIAAFWPRVRQRGLFLVSPSVLFAKGQEQRLREHMLLGRCSLSSVTLLPSRQLSMATLAPALIVLDRECNEHSVRFIDATEITIDSRSSMRYARVLDHERLAPLILGTSDDEKVVCNAGIEDIAVQDFNLIPARYLRPALKEAGGPRLPLGDFVTVVRAPVASKEATAVTVQEAGFPELDRWRAVSGPFAKTTAIHARKLDDAILREGDVLLSIKGTLGKSALIGHVALFEQVVRFGANPTFCVPLFPDVARAPVVPSQSCIALRIRNNAMNPLLLFMYLRSDDFKKQIDALRLGATIAHVTPTTLLQGIFIPVLPEAEQQAYIRHYAELCELEASIEDAQQRSDEIRKALWPTDA